MNKRQVDALVKAVWAREYKPFDIEVQLGAFVFCRDRHLCDVIVGPNGRYIVRIAANTLAAARLLRHYLLVGTPDEITFKSRKTAHAAIVEILTTGVWDNRKLTKKQEAAFLERTTAC